MKDDKPTANPVVFTYKIEVSLDGPARHERERAQKNLNRAWGFEDGECNIVDNKGNMIPKPGSDSPEFSGAHRRMDRCERVAIRISVHKDGTKSFELEM